MIKNRNIVLLLVILTLCGIFLSCIRCVSVKVLNQTNSDIFFRVELSGGFQKDFGIVPAMGEINARCIAKETYDMSKITYPIKLIILKNDSIVLTKEVTIKQLEQQHWTVIYDGSSLK